MTIRITAHVLRALECIVSLPADEASGAAISRITGLPSGTLYPLLMRLESAGWLSSKWEKAEPSDLGRPRRRLYRVTAKGAAHAREAATGLVKVVGRLAT